MQFQQKLKANCKLVSDLLKTQRFHSRGVYAEDSKNPLHAVANAWWDKQLNGETPVCLCWIVINAFIRIATNARVFKRPLTLGEACSRVQSWLNQPVVRIINPTQNHWEILHPLLIKSQAPANLVTDAHLAALALTHGCTLYSTDQDFSRFAKLKWKNPLVNG